MNVFYHKRFGKCIMLDMDDNTITIKIEDGTTKKVVRKIVELYNDEFFIDPYDKEYNFSKYSLSNAMNMDLGQPQRAIYNYLERECENSAYKDDPIEFYQNILDVANHLIEMYKEGSHIV